MYEQFGDIVFGARALGQHAEAVEMGKVTLALDQKVLPPGHVDLGVSMSNLATTYRTVGDHGKAAELQEAALQKVICQRKEALLIMMRALALNHPFVKTIGANLAKSFISLGRHAEASMLNERVLQHKLPDFGSGSDVLNFVAPTLCTAPSCTRRAG